MTSLRTSAAGQKLQQQVAAYNLIKSTTGATPGATPDPQLYGIYGPSYAASLAADNQGDSDRAQIVGPGSQALLGANADQERRDYAKALTAAQAGAMQMEALKGRNATNAALANQLATEGKYGLIGAVNAGADGSVQVDPVSGMAANEFALNGQAADIRKANSEANKNNYDAGLTTDPNVAAQRDTNPLQSNQDPAYGVFAGRGDYKDVADNEHNIRADANDAIKAQAAMVDAKKPGRASSGGDISLSVVPGGYGQSDQVTTRMKGKAASAYLASHGGVDGNAGTGLPANVQAMIAQGYKIDHAGTNLVVTSPRGQQAMFNPVGVRIK